MKKLGPTAPSALQMGGLKPPKAKDRKTQTQMEHTMTTSNPSVHSSLKSLTIDTLTPQQLDQLVSENRANKEALEALQKKSVESIDRGYSKFEMNNLQAQADVANHELEILQRKIEEEKKDFKVEVPEYFSKSAKRSIERALKAPTTFEKKREVIDGIIEKEVKAQTLVEKTTSLLALSGKTVMVGTVFVVTIWLLSKVFLTTTVEMAAPVTSNLPMPS